MSFNDLRKGRYSLAGQIYLVTTVTQSRRPLFADHDNARLLIREMRVLEDEGLVRSLCFVVMPDHLHWLLSLGSGHTLGDCIQRLKGRSARKLKARAAIRGKVWQGAFHDHALRRDEDVIDVARYVVRNPVRAGIVTRVGLYPHWDAVWVRGE